MSAHSCAPCRLLFATVSSNDRDAISQRLDDKCIEVNQRILSTGTPEEIQKEQPRGGGGQIGSQEDTHLNKSTLCDEAMETYIIQQISGET